MKKKITYPAVSAVVLLGAFYTGCAIQSPESTQRPQQINVAKARANIQAPTKNPNAQIKKGSYGHGNDVTKKSKKSKKSKKMNKGNAYGHDQTFKDKPRPRPKGRNYF